MQEAQNISQRVKDKYDYDLLVDELALCLCTFPVEI